MTTAPWAQAAGAATRQVCGSCPAAAGPVCACRGTDGVWVRFAGGARTRGALRGACRDRWACLPLSKRAPPPRDRWACHPGTAGPACLLVASCSSLDPPPPPLAGIATQAEAAAAAAPMVAARPRTMMGWAGTLWVAAATGARPRMRRAPWAATISRAAAVAAATPRGRRTTTTRWAAGGGAGGGGGGPRGGRGGPGGAPPPRSCWAAGARGGPPPPTCWRCGCITARAAQGTEHGLSP